MPRIPLFNGGQSVQTNAPTPSRGSTGGNSSLYVPVRTASASGVKQAVNDAGRAVIEGNDAMGRAGQQSQLPYALAEHVAVQNSAIDSQAIASALSDTAQMFSMVAEKEQQIAKVKVVSSSNLEMLDVIGGFRAELAKDHDYESWGEKWQATVEATRARLLDAAPFFAEDEIAARLGQWAIEGNIEFKTHALIQKNNEAKDLLNLEGDEAVDVGNVGAFADVQRRKAESGLYRPSELAVSAYNGEQRMQADRRARDTSQMQAALVAGNSEVSQFIYERAKKSGDWVGEKQSAALDLVWEKAKETAVSIQRDKAMKSALDMAEKNPRQMLAELEAHDEKGSPTGHTELEPDQRRYVKSVAQELVSVENAETQNKLWTLALKGRMLPDSVIDEERQKGRIDDEFAKRLKSVAYASRPDAASVTANAFGDEAYKYDPDEDDAMQSNKMTLRANAFEAGLSKSQLERVDVILGEAEKRNSTPEGRAETLSIGWITGEIKKFAPAETTRNELDSHLKGALSDTSKLQRFGLDSGTAGEISKLARSDSIKDHVAAFKLFKSVAAAAVPLDAAALKEAKLGEPLSEWEMNLFREALSAGDDLMVKVRPTAMQERTGAVDVAKMTESSHMWARDFIKKNNRPPTARESAEWLNGQTQKIKPVSGWQNFMRAPKPTAMRAPSESTMKPVAETTRYTELEDGSLVGTASSYGYPGDADNGFNSIGMKRGEQPWFGEHPTVALAPAIAKKLGVQLPRWDKKKKEFDLSKSYVEIEANGQRSLAIYDENGMYIDPRSMDKLVDLTPEASAALGLPVKNNAKVTVRRPA